MFGEKSPDFMDEINRAVIRCPTERMPRGGYNLELAKLGEIKNTDIETSQNNEGEEPNYQSIDLDKELLGTSYSKSRQDKDGVKMRGHIMEDPYLSPDVHRKDSLYSRKITGVTENTKADSALRRSEIGSRQNRRNKIAQGFDLESLHSCKMFNTKSSEEAKAKNSSCDLSIDNIETASNLQNPDSSISSIPNSSMSNSQLKQTADFFRPGDAPKEATSKRFSFGRNFQGDQIHQNSQKTERQHKPSRTPLDYRDPLKLNLNSKLKIPKTHLSNLRHLKWSKIDIKVSYLASFF